ncbi:MAG: ASCH domain-containing protein [Bacteroidota bacterium]
MKYFSLVLLIVFIISCKNDPKGETKIEPEPVAETQSKAENQVDPSVLKMWEAYISAHPEFKDVSIPEADFFHNNREDANRLAQLTIEGKKQASSGLYSLYKQYQVDLPTIGTKQIVTDFGGKAKAIIENTQVDTIPFHQVTQEYATLDMGTDVEPLKKWRKAHWDFFEGFLKESGGAPSEEMLVVCVRFKTIWPKLD